MRLWPYEMFPYLPERQFRGQLRELVAIMHDWRDNGDWRDKGSANHLLINFVMEYPKADLLAYYHLYRREWRRRYGKDLHPELTEEFERFAWYSEPCSDNDYPFSCWLPTKYYWRICMANLAEKHLASGPNRITDEEWDLLCKGYSDNNGGEKYRL